MEAVEAFTSASVVNRVTDIQMTVRGERVTFRYEEQCHVCRNGYRKEIEHWIFLGMGATAILKMLPEEAKAETSRFPVSVRSLARHRDNHMPPRDLIAQALIDQRALLTGNSFVEANGSLLDGHIFATQVLQVGYEKLSSGQMDVKVADVLAALKYVDDLTAGDDSAQRDKLASQAFVVLIDTLRSELPADVYDRVMRRMSSNEMIINLSRQAAQLALEASAVDG